MSAKAAIKDTRHSRGPSVQFRLYIAGTTRKSLQAFENLDTFCKKYISVGYKIEVVDLKAEPRAARKDNIVALPTMLKIAPGPALRVIGDCSNTSQMLRILDIVEK